MIYPGSHEKDSGIKHQVQAHAISLRQVYQLLTNTPGHSFYPFSIICFQVQKKYMVIVES